jgi:hypothetical protein
MVASIAFVFLQVAIVLNFTQPFTPVLPPHYLGNRVTRTAASVAPAPCDDTQVIHANNPKMPLQAHAIMSSFFSNLASQIPQRFVLSSHAIYIRKLGHSCGNREYESFGIVSVM